MDQYQYNNLKRVKLPQPKTIDCVIKSIGVLDLGFELGWEILASPKAESMVEWFANIQSLKPRIKRPEKQMLFVDSTEMEALKIYDKVSLTVKIRDSKIHFSDDRNYIVCEIDSNRDSQSLPITCIESSYPVYESVINSGGLPLHAGLVVRKGNGIALAGTSGVGKSTCCQRIPYPWEVPADDEVLYSPREHGGYKIHPLPTWSEYLFDENCTKTWNIETHFPFSALFFLEQSNRDEVIPMNKGQAAINISQSAIQVFTRMFGEAYKGKLEHKRTLFKNACRLANDIPVFRLLHSIKGQFWEEIERVI